MANDDTELTHIYVVPTHRLRGIGVRMIQSYIEKTTVVKLSSFFDCTPAAHDFFLAVGFKDTGYHEIDLAQWAPPFSGFGPFRLYGMTGSNVV